MGESKGRPVKRQKKEIWSTFFPKRNERPEKNARPSRPIQEHPDFADKKN
jgi:hypothetical protein